MDGGKRLRPIIILDICKNYGKNIEFCIESALAIELIHCSSLVIDDMPCMDNDDYRQINYLHKKYSSKNAQIISAAMLSIAYKLLFDNFKKINYKNIEILINNINKNLCLLGLAGGQLMDLNKNLFSNDDTNIEKEKKIKLLFQKKTCSLFEISFITGYILAEKDLNVENIDLLKKASYNFGLAFQIYDDFFDIDQDKLRKTINPNYITNFGLQQSFDVFKNSLNIFKKIMEELNLYSDVMQQLFLFLTNKVNEKI